METSVKQMDDGPFSASGLLLHRTSLYLYCFLMMQFIMLLPVKHLVAQSAIGQLEAATNSKISKYSGSSGVLSPQASMQTMVVGTVMQSLLQSIFSTDNKAKAAQQAAEQARQQQLAAEKAEQERLQAIKDKKAYDDLMQMTKTLPDGKANLDFKNLNGDAENLSRAASDQFTPGSGKVEVVTPGGGTNFFGSQVSQVDQETVVDTENSPNVVDLRGAQEKIVKNIKQDSAQLAKLLTTDGTAKGEPIVQKPACKDLVKELNGYVQNREKFKAEIDKTAQAVAEWQSKKDEAFWNAITDAMGFAASSFLDYVKEIRESALKVRAVLDANKERYLAENIFTQEELQKYYSILDARVANFKVADFGTKLSDAAEYYEVLRGMIQTQLIQYDGCQSDYAALVKVIKEHGALSDFPAVDLEGFAARKIINKFLDNPSITKGCLKMSWVGLLQLGVDEAFNGFQWLTSYNNLCKLHDISGQETKAADFIQHKINETKQQLLDCSQN